MKKQIELTTESRLGLKLIQFSRLNDLIGIAKDANVKCDINKKRIKEFHDLGIFAYRWKTAYPFNKLRIPEEFSPDEEEILNCIAITSNICGFSIVKYRKDLDPRMNWYIKKLLNFIDNWVKDYREHEGIIKEISEQV